MGKTGEPVEETIKTISWCKQGKLMMGSKLISVRHPSITSRTALPNIELESKQCIEYLFYKWEPQKRTCIQLCEHLINLNTEQESNWTNIDIGLQDLQISDVANSEK